MEMMLLMRKVNELQRVHVRIYIRREIPRVVIEETMACSWRANMN